MVADQADHPVLSWMCSYALGAHLALPGTRNTDTNSGNRKKEKNKQLTTELAGQRVLHHLGR
jgi:hypothetical protein